MTGALGLHDPRGDALDRGGVGDRRAAVLLDDDSHVARFYEGEGVALLEHLIGDREILGVDGEVLVEAVVGDDREQRVERDAGEVAPRGDVGELPPPQRLVDVAGAVVAQAVLEVARDRGEVVGELALDDLGDVGVEDVAVGVDRVEHRRPAGAAGPRGRPRARRRAGTPRAGVKSVWTPEPGARRARSGVISSSSSGMALPTSFSSAIARRASRKLSTELAICWAKSSVAESSIAPTATSLSRSIGVVSSSSRAPPSCERPPEGDLVGVLQVPAHGQSAGEPADRQVHVLQHTGEKVAVASPSRLGSVARITSVTVPSASRVISSRIRSWSGPMPSIGEIAPPSTW